MKVPELAEDHAGAQGLQETIRLHFRAGLELGLTIACELLAEGQGDGGNREENGRGTDDLPGQNPRHGRQPRETREFFDQDEDAGRVRIAAQDQVQSEAAGNEAHEEPGRQTEREQQRDTVHGQNSRSLACVRS